LHPLEDRWNPASSAAQAGPRTVRPQSPTSAGHTRWIDRTEEVKMGTTSTHDNRNLWRAFPAGLAIATALALGASTTAAGASDAPGSGNAAAHVWWSGADPDGGYRCLQQTGGVPGQCDAALGLGPWAIPATDGGYRCLRDTLGAGGQCNEAMGLSRPDVP
jgi:hypothetical protein